MATVWDEAEMELGRRCSRCPRRRSSSAHGCWTVRSRS
ncbi:PSMC3 isoform 7 [Pan troglodytes]|uniref:Proteasome 26S subunit, ATPase 3 n=3 Tax=Hominidae TaxID=9604 RepID=E9PS45_HUMAN|nr:PSMC3 isoform 7 [Pan troglodytes]PNJ68282.1 PSMC3 isoform 7 [Pongo abelii]